MYSTSPIYIVSQKLRTATINHPPSEMIIDHPPCKLCGRTPIAYTVHARASLCLSAVIPYIRTS